MSSAESSSDEAPSKVLKTAYDVQRMRLEKLMKNPTKPVVIPEPAREKKQLYVPDFVRNVMGSSAGAGSGEFHVYRHLRRKEYARQKTIAEMSEKERLDKEFQEKLEHNQREAEERTAKKRAKRLRKKQKLKEKLQGKKQKKCDHDDKNQKVPSSSDDGDTDDKDSDTDEKKTT